MTPNRLVASRTLRRLDNSSRVDVEVYVPDMNDGVWQCAYCIRGDGLEVKAFACGEDSMQSLMLCFDAIRKALDELPCSLTWVSGDSGDVGISRALPIYYGIGFQHKVEAVVEAMVEEQAKFLQREHAMTRLEQSTQPVPPPPSPK